MIASRILAELKERLSEAYGERLHAVVLFGSEARGNAGPDSDIDVLAVLETLAGDYGEELEPGLAAVYPIALQLGRRVSVKPLAREEYERGDSPLLREVRRSGIDRRSHSEPTPEKRHSGGGAAGPGAALGSKTGSQAYDPLGSSAMPGTMDAKVLSASLAILDKRLSGAANFGITRIKMGGRQGKQIRPAGACADQENAVLKKPTALTALVLGLLASLSGIATAETLVQYLGGTSSTAAYNVAAGITGSTLGSASTDGFRTSFGTAGATPAGPTAGTAAGSSWLLWRKSAITESLSASDNYAGFTITIGAAADGVILGDLAFDLAGGAANSATGGIDVNYQVFAQVNGGGFSPVGSASGFIQLLADTTINAFSPVLTGTVGLSALGALGVGDTVDIRIAVQSEDGAGATNIGLFMQGIKIVAVPEPGSLAMIGVGIGGLVIISRRRRV